MKLIIFLEEGVRDPGGLYGNLEYISFSRNHPNDSFDKLLQMLSSLSPIEGSSLQAEPKPSASEEKPTSVHPDILEPRPSWAQDDYDTAIFHAIWGDEKEALEKINQAYEASLLAKGQALPIWRANEEYLRMLLGKNPNFDRLKTIASENPDNSKILYYLARGYAEYDDHAQAAKMFQEAARHSKDEEERLRNLGEAATELAYTEEKQRAIELLDKIKENVGDNQNLMSMILPYIQRLAEIQKDEDFSVAVMERAVDLRPSDFDARFNLAYKHSQLENEDMALQHYIKIPAANRSAITWNNLGVSLKQFEIPVKSVRAFRKSEMMNETLAMSNLGFKFLSAGFLEEARQLCDKALQASNYHKSIPQLLVRLRDVPDEEQKKLDDVLENVKPKAAFYRKAGEAVALPQPKTFYEKWESPECVLDAVVEGTKVRMSGAYESAGSALAGLVSGGFVLPPPVKNKLEYVGELRGRAIFGTVSRVREGQSTSVFDLASNRVKVLMCLGEREIHVMENVMGPAPKFYVLKQIS